MSHKYSPEQPFLETHRSSTLYDAIVNSLTNGIENNTNFGLNLSERQVKQSFSSVQESSKNNIKCITLKKHSCYFTSI